MTNQAIADILEEIGTLLELRGENPFKSRAYHNAARTIGSLTSEVSDLVKNDSLREIKGIGQGLAEKIAELVNTGKSEYHEELRKSLPAGLPELLRLPGLGPKRIKILYETLKISSIDALKKAIDEHRIASIPGFGEKTEENIKKSISHLEQHAEQHLFSEAQTSAQQIVDLLKKQPYIIRCEVAGSLRRKKEIIGDIDILASVKGAKASALMDVFTKNKYVQDVVARGDTKASVILAGSGIHCDLRVVKEKEYAFALAYFTGGKEHNVAMRTLAKQYGWSLNEYRFSPLTKKKTAPPSCKTEAEIFSSLRLSYIPPELRENMGEIEAAKEETLPKLVEESDLRGTFHCHSTYSDGNNSLEEMAQGAIDLGWEYLGIADHSKVAAYAGGLTEARVKQQHKEIDRLNSRFKNFRIFKGTEVDILSGGELDWSNKVLFTFDYVVASIHSKFKMTEQEATKRIISALKNKYVTMLGHPTGRLLLQREGYPVNMHEVINAAADYGKIIEINSHPFRLDLDWRLVKYAKEKGVKISINPDAHAVNGLRDVRFGIGIARKGWLTKNDVVNTRSLKDVAAFLNISPAKT